MPSHLLPSSFTLDLSLFHSFISNSSALLRKIFPQSLCAPPFTPPSQSSPWSRLLTPSLSSSLPHVQRRDHAVALSHLHSAPLANSPPASFYFSVSSWQQHHIIRLNLRANMPPHLNRLRRMKVATALQTQFLQSVLFPTCFLYARKHTVAHAVFVR